MSFRKMAVVPHNLVDQFLTGQRQHQQIVSEAPVETLSDLDKEMKMILESKEPPEWKAKRYQQVLQQYNAIRSNFLHPSVREIVEEPENASEKVLRNLANTYRRTGQMLLNHVTEHPQFTWDSDLEVSINGRPIKGSNLIDLIHAFSKPTTKQKPEGWKEFSQALNDTHAPKVAIANRNLTVKDEFATPKEEATPHPPSSKQKRRNYRTTPGSVQQTIPQIEGVTPKKRATRRTVQKHEWEDY